MLIPKPNRRTDQHVRLGIYIHETQRDQILAIAEENGTSLNRVITHILKKALDDDNK